MLDGLLVSGRMTNTHLCRNIIFGLTNAACMHTYMYTHTDVHRCMHG